eukprot:90168-Pyramimonas_sp.AAC.1
MPPGPRRTGWRRPPASGPARRTKAGSFKVATIGILVKMAELTSTGTTVDSSGAAKGGGLTEYLSEVPEGDLFAVRGHRAFGDKLSSPQGQARDLGYHGLWAPGQATGTGALEVSGGAALL